MAKTNPNAETKVKKKIVAVEVPDEEVSQKDTEDGEIYQPEEKVVSEPAQGDKEAKPKKTRSRRAKKEKTEEEKIEAGSQFYSHPVSLASKAERASLSKTEHVIAEDGEQEYNAHNNTWMEEYKELAGSAESGRILTGEIVGMRHTDPQDIESTLIADVKFKTGALQVNIPVDLLFNYDEDSYRGEGGAKQLEESLRSRITGPVRFVVRSVDQKTGVAYADSLEAQARVVNNYYINNGPKMKHPRICMKKDTNGEPVGPLVKARVIAVSFSSIVVDAIGAEIKIGLDELSYTHISDPRNKYRVGDDITVRLLSIEKEVVKKRNNQYTLIKAKGSVKRVDPDNRKQYFDNFVEEGIYSATVTYISETGQVFCSLKDQYDCLCKYPVYGQKPLIGQKKVVKVTKKDPEKLFIFGIFVGN